MELVPEHCVLKKIENGEVKPIEIILTTQGYILFHYLTINMKQFLDRPQPQFFPKQERDAAFTYLDMWISIQGCPT